ncbi:hypothetical protein GCM10020218_058150 [Dactylosporangium vinaceum]
MALVPDISGVQGRRHLADDLEPDKRTEDEHGDREHQVIAHRLSPSTCHGDRGDDLVVAIGAGRPASSSSTAVMLRQYSATRAGAMVRAGFAAPITVTPSGGHDRAARHRAFDVAAVVARGGVHDDRACRIAFTASAVTSSGGVPREPGRW